jgi:hypothetical protein
MLGDALDQRAAQDLARSTEALEEPFPSLDGLPMCQVAEFRLYDVLP